MTKRRDPDAFEGKAMKWDATSEARLRELEGQHHFKRDIAEIMTREFNPPKPPLSRRRATIGWPRLSRCLG